VSQEALEHLARGGAAFCSMHLARAYFSPLFGPLNPPCPVSTLSCVCLYPLPPQFGVGAISRLTAACPSLEVLLLDRCDLPDDGFDLCPSPYGALSHVLLARCRAVEAGLSARSGGPAAAGLDASCWWLPLERDVKVMRLSDGAVSKEPMYSL
jgi:hypothetical protein